jgi:hypothetical protein
LRRFLAAILVALAACTGPYPSDVFRDPVLPAYPEPGRTYLVFDAGQGFRIERFGEDGRVTVWAGGTFGLVTGFWRIDDRLRLKNAGPALRGAGADLCLSFAGRAPDTLGPNDWDCRPRRRLADQAVAELAGDPFGLDRARAPPFPFERCVPPPAFRLLRPAGC